MSWLSNRFWIFALAIVAPAVIVAILGYLSLRQWERSADLLFREQARDVAAMAADKIEMLLRQSDDELLARLGAIVEGGDVRSGTLEAFTRETPLVHRLYLFDRRGQLLYPPTPGADDAAVVAALLREASPGVWERGVRREVVVADRSILAATLRGHDGTPVLVAVAR